MKSKYISRTLLAIACVALTGLGGCISIKKDEPSSTTTTTRSVSAPVVGGTTVERTTTSY